jgi:hypothetical protein
MQEDTTKWQRFSTERVLVFTPMTIEAMDKPAYAKSKASKQRN